MDLYLERNKDVSFLVLREYACCQTKSYSTERHRLESDTDTAPMTMLVEEHIDVVSHTLRSMLASLSHAALQGIPHPRFSHDRGDDSDGINESDNNFKSRYNYYNARKNLRVSYPYLWFYHRRQEIAEAIDHLEEAQRKHLSIFCRYIRDRMFEEWSDVDKLVAESQITAEYIQYIFVSIVTKLIVLVSHHGRSLGKLSFRHPKAAQQPNYKRPWSQTGCNSTMKILISFHHLFLRLLGVLTADFKRMNPLYTSGTYLP